tara:strand:- start:57 stop:551 length:495 start_codon:yes stop_codon:yes gene_type:complete
MPDYSKTIIYKICCKNLDVKEIYVGSTCNFTKRKGEHKKDSIFENRKNHNSKVYKFIRENGGFDNWDMVMIEEYSCENKMQKTQRERYWCEELKSELNSNVPGRSKKESNEAYRSQHRNQLCQYSKEYNEKNKEHRKKYREANKDKINQKRRELYHKKKNELLT